MMEKYKPNFEKVIEFLKNDLSGLRTNRATTALVDNVQVDAYGGKMALKGLANITIPDPKTIVVEPWDKTLLKEVEKAITQTGIKIGITNEGHFIRLTLPALNEENRKDLVKLLNQKLEQTKINIRSVREKAKEDIIDEEKKKKIAEDDKFRFIEELDKMTHEYNQKIHEIGAKKEEEIMKI